MNAGFQRAGKLSNVPNGGMTSVTLPDGTEILLMRVNGQVFATEIMCSHQETWLDSGFFHAASLEIECPLHEGKFDARTGAVTNPPPTEPIRAYEVKVEGDEIFVGPQK